MTVAELEAAYLAAKDARDAAYWRFSRTSRGNPVAMCDLSKLTAEARRAWMEAKR
jgi:hypothetical protein